MRAFEHLYIILSNFAYVKGGSLNQGHSQGLEGYFRVVSDGVFRLLRRVGSSQFHNLLITQTLVGSSYSDADTVSLAWRNKNVPSTEAIPSSSSVGVLPFRFQIAHIPKAKSGAIPSFIYLSTKLVIF